LEEKLNDSGLFDRDAITAVPFLKSQWKLLRFLRGWKNDVEEAFKAFEAMANWREENEILSIRQELLEIESREGNLPFPYDLSEFEPLVELIGKGLLQRHGFDKHGNVLTTVLVGEFQLKQVAAEGEEMVKLLIRGQMYIDEYFDIVLQRLTEERGSLARRHDLLNVSNPSIGLLQFTPAAVRLITQSTEGSQHYPEAVARITSCGNGYLAIGLWKIISPFVPKHTKQKIQVLGTKYYSTLLQDITEENIPTAFQQIDE